MYYACIRCIMRIIYRRFRGVSPACPPPVSGDRLRFVFVFVSCVSCVPCVRARRSCVGACRPLSLSLGLPGASIRVFRARFRAPFRLVFVHRCMGFNTFCCFLCPFACLLSTGAWVLRFLIAKTLCFTWVLRFVIDCSSSSSRV